MSTITFLFRLTSHEDIDLVWIIGYAGELVVYFWVLSIQDVPSVLDAEGLVLHGSIRENMEDVNMLNEAATRLSRRFKAI